ncbi:hypothetical protein OAC78_04945 [Litorivicinus sp.]|nr:hypothetical protein [Litorivicinus sp.]
MLSLFYALPIYMQIIEIFILMSFLGLGLRLKALSNLSVSLFSVAVYILFWWILGSRLPSADEQYFFDAGTAIVDSFGNSKILNINLFSLFGWHFLYPLINFGFGWLGFPEAILFFNLACTLLTAKILSVIYRETFPKSVFGIDILTVLFYISFLLSGWPVATNFKGALANFLIVGLIYYFMQASKAVTASRLIAIAFFVTCLIFTRFYSAFVLVFCFALCHFLSNRRIMNPLAVCAMFFGSAYFFVMSGLAEFLIGKINVSFESFYNLVNFLITPLPWNIVSDYKFVLLGVWQYWLAIPFFMLGLVRALLSKKINLTAIAMIVLVSIVSFSIIPGYDGVRHRHGFFSLIVFMQIAGFELLGISIRRRFYG